MVMEQCSLKGFLFVLIVVLFTSNNYAAEKFNLEFRPKLGQKHRMQIVTTNKIKQKIGGKQQNINHTKAVELEFEVKEVDANGIASIKVTYQSLREKTESVSGGFEYDSKKPSTAKGNPFAPMYTAMMGQSFTARVTPEGKIVELRGLDEMFLQMAEKMTVAEDKLIGKRTAEKLNKSHGSREKRKKALKEMIKKNPLNADVQIMKMVRNVITDFTNRPVGIGDSWKAKVIPPYAPLSEIGVTYTLKGDNKGVVSVDVSSKIDLNDVSDSTGKKHTPPMKITVVYQGTLQIDKASGWVIGKKVKVQLSVQVTQQGRVVPMSIESTVTVKPTESITTR